MPMKIRTYSELIRFQTLDERFEYLRLWGSVGEPTFGSERFLNQRFYRSAEWRHIRNHIIVRDNGCDLGVTDFEVFDQMYIHHMNPMTIQQVKDADPDIFDPEYLISCSLRTHNAIHYGDASQLPKKYVPRRPGDTKLW